MSFVEDVRNVVQDLVAPSLKELGAKLDALTQRVDALEKHFDKRFSDMDRRFDEVMSGINHLIRYNALEQRIAALEQQKTQ